MIFLTSLGSPVAIPCILCMIEGTIAAISSTTIPPKNTHAPAIATPRDIFFAFVLLFIRGSNSFIR